MTRRAQNEYAKDEDEVHKHHSLTGVTYGAVVTCHIIWRCAWSRGKQRARTCRPVAFAIGTSTQANLLLCLPFHLHWCRDYICFVLAVGAAAALHTLASPLLGRNALPLVRPELEPIDKCLTTDITCHRSQSFVKVQELEWRHSYSTWAVKFLPSGCIFKTKNTPGVGSKQTS